MRKIRLLGYAASTFALRATADKSADSLRVKLTRCSWRSQPKLAVGERRLVSQTFISWNQIGQWLRQLDRLRTAAFEP